jgi:hypothetical protein
MSHVTVVLAHGQFEVLQRALADAVFYRDPPLSCPDCPTPDQLCAQCATGFSQASAYLTLSRELNISSAGPASRTSDPANLATRPW